MRKTIRLIIIGLFLTVAFGGCQKIDKKTENQENTNAESQAENGFQVVIPKGGLADLTPYQIMKEPERLQPDFIDKFIVSKEYQQVYPFVQRRNEWHIFWGFCDQNGRVICDGIYDNVVYIGDETEGFYLCIQQKSSLAGDERLPVTNYVIISSKGDYYQEYEYVVFADGMIDGDGYYILQYLEGELEAVSVKLDGKWGTLDKFGKPALPPIYEDKLIFKEQLAAVRLSEHTYGYINLIGELALGPFSYEFYPEETEGYHYIIVSDRVPFYQDGKWGYLNAQGGVEISPIYDKVWPFDKSGYARVLIGDERDYIDIEGKSISAMLQNQEMEDYYGGGWFVVAEDEKQFYWNITGRMVALESTLSFITKSGWLVQDEKDIFFYKDEDTLVVEDFSIMGQLNNGNLLCTNSLSQRWCLISANGKMISEPKPGTFFFLDMEDYIVVAERDGYHVYDGDGNEIQHQPLKELVQDLIQKKYYQLKHIHGDYSVVYDMYHGGVRYRDGSWLIRVSYLEGME